MRVIGLIAVTAAAILAPLPTARAHEPGPGYSDVHGYLRVTIVCGDGDNHSSMTSCARRASARWASSLPARRPRVRAG